MRLAVTALLGRAAGGVTFDEEEFGLGRIALLTISELAWQAGDAHRALAAHFARAASGFARGGGIDHLLDDRLGIAGVFLEPFAHFVAHQRFERRAHFGRDQLVFGLAGELGVRQLDADDGGQAFAHILARKADLFLLQHPRTLGVIVERAGQRGAEGREVRAAVALGDVVGEGEHVLVVGIVPFQCDVDTDPVLLGRDRDRLAHQRLLVAIEIFDEGGDPALEIEIVFKHFLVAQIAQLDAHARIEERQLAVTVFELLEIEFGDVLEGVVAGLEGHAGALLAGRRIALDDQRRDGIAVGEPHPVLLAFAPDGEFEPFGQGVDHRNADTVQAARDLVGVVVRGVLELPARVQLGHDHLGRRHAFFGVHAGGNAAPVIFHRNRAIGVQFDQNEVAMPRQRLVDGIVRDFEHHVVQARSVVGIADIHPRALAHRIEAFENLDRIRAILVGVGQFFGGLARSLGIGVVHADHIGARHTKPNCGRPARRAFPRVWRAVRRAVRKAR